MSRAITAIWPADTATYIERSWSAPAETDLSTVWTADDSGCIIGIPPSQTGDYHIEQIRHSIGGTPRHVCNLLVSRVIAKALQFGVSEFDGTDVFVY